MIKKRQRGFYFVPLLIGYDVCWFGGINSYIFHPLFPPFFLIPMLVRVVYNPRYFLIEQVHDIIYCHIAVLGSVTQKTYHFFFPIKSRGSCFQKVRFKIIVATFVYLTFVKLLSHQSCGIYDFCHVTHVIFQTVYPSSCFFSIEGHNIIVVLTHKHFCVRLGIHKVEKSIHVFIHII